MAWSLLFEVKGGHRYFDEGNGSIAVADDSGETPDQTDDGILWLNRSAPIIVEKGDGFFLIPLRTVNGESTRTMAGAIEALRVACRFNLPILTEDGVYTVTQNH